MIKVKKSDYANMPQHKPIKFEVADESIAIQVKRIISENKTAKTVLNATLAIIATGGILTMGIVAPKLLREVSNALHKKRKRAKEKYREIWRRFNVLKKKGALEFVKEENGRLVYRLSEKGKEKIRKFIIDELHLPNPTEWDKKWHLIIFDIPERYKKARSAFRGKLEDMGFYQCQKSVWIHPFPCMEEVEFLKDVFKIKPFVKIFTVDEMTDGKTLYYFRNLLKETKIK